ARRRPPARTRAARSTRPPSRLFPNRDRLSIESTSTPSAQGRRACGQPSNARAGSNRLWGPCAARRARGLETPVPPPRSADNLPRTRGAVTGGGLSRTLLASRASSRNASSRGEIASLRSRNSTPRVSCARPLAVKGRAPRRGSEPRRRDLGEAGRVPGKEYTPVGHPLVAAVAFGRQKNARRAPLESSVHDSPNPTGSRPTGLLLVNLGTPDAPEERAVRRYLRQF